MGCTPFFPTELILRVDTLPWKIPTLFQTFAKTDRVCKGVLTKKHGTNLPVLLVFEKFSLAYVPMTIPSWVIFSSQNPSKMLVPIGSGILVNRSLWQMRPCEQATFRKILKAYGLPSRKIKMTYVEKMTQGGMLTGKSILNHNWTGGGAESV